MWGKSSLRVCELRLRGSGGVATPLPAPPRGDPPPPILNPYAIYNTWARFGDVKIQCAVGFARCKGWHARGVAFLRVNMQQYRTSALQPALQRAASTCSLAARSRTICSFICTLAHCSLAPGSATFAGGIEIYRALAFVAPGLAL